MNYVTRHIGILIINFLAVGCVEEIDLENETESAKKGILVVEATLTNELKKQEVKLSRTIVLGTTNEVSAEVNATVNVVTEQGLTYTFTEDTSGHYVSLTQFAALPNEEYRLEISTQDGKLYKSESAQLPQDTEIDNLYTAIDLNENGNEGVSIYIDAFDPTGNSKYYRFEYQEAYRIQAPFWVPQDLELGTPPDEPQFIFVPRPIEEQVCYNEDKSKAILITNTLDLEEDRLDQYRIRFINRNNYIISHRYTIEVKQFVLSRDAYVYYETLNNFSSSESILSETQVGFLEGNITSINNSSEKIVGFFDVASVDVERLYFNYEDLFPNQELPPYIQNCSELAKPATFNPLPVGPICPLCDYIEDGNWKYWQDNPDFNPTDPAEGPYLLVNRECGDCTSLGSSDPPEYWID